MKKIWLIIGEFRDVDVKDRLMVPKKILEWKYMMKQLSY